MALWFFQLTEEQYPLAQFRLNVWEGERWRFFVRPHASSISPSGRTPDPGDLVVFFYAAKKAVEDGFIGLGVVQQWRSQHLVEQSEPLHELCFRPVTPNDYLKVYPWGDAVAIGVANAVRGGMMQRTLWLVEEEQSGLLRQGIVTWLSGG